MRAVFRGMVKTAASNAARRPNVHPTAITGRTDRIGAVFLASGGRMRNTSK